MEEPMKPMDAPVEEHMNETKTPKIKNKDHKKWLKKLLMLLALLVILAGAAYGGYWWRDRDAKQDSRSKNEEITSLKSQLDESKKAAESSASEEESSDETTTTLPTAAQLDNIQAAITSGNTAALEGYMASSVNVIIAASEGLGTRTPAQAVGDLDYLVSASVSWDFSLSSATLASYAGGSYSSYFPSGALVGKSSENKVVSFVFNSSAKISTIFMSASDDLLL